MGRFLLAALMLTLAAGSPAVAAPAKGRHAKQTVALTPAEADGAFSKSALEGIDRVLASHAGANAEVIGTKLLDKRAKPDFATAVHQCKRDGGCLSRLAKNLHVDAILVPVAKPEARGTSLAITVADDHVHTVTFVFVTSADLNAAITANAVALFGEGATNTEGVAALPLEPLETPPEPAEAKPETVVAAPPPITAAAQPVIEPPPLDDSIVIRREEPIVTWKTYVGAPAAVIGAVAATYGIMQYAHHRSLVNDANGDDTLTQREAAAIDDEAQSAYDRSRIAVFVGAPLLVAGAALVVWDLFVDDHTLTSPSNDEGVSLSLIPNGRGGASGSLSFTF